MTAGTTYFDPGRFRATAPIPSPLWEKLGPSTSRGPFRRVRPTASSIGGEGDSGPGVVPSIFQPAEVDSSPDR